MVFFVTYKVGPGPIVINGVIITPINEATWMSRDGFVRIKKVRKWVISPILINGYYIGVK